MRVLLDIIRELFKNEPHFSSCYNLREKNVLIAVRVFIDQQLNVSYFIVKWNDKQVLGQPQRVGAKG